MANGLSKSEQELWLAWQRARDAVNTRVASDIGRTAELGLADFEILLRLGDVWGEQLRMHELRTLLGWEKSRLPIQIRRMQARGLLARTSLGPSATMVRMTAAGRRALGKARAAYVGSVRRHLIDKISPPDRKLLLGLLHRFAELPPPAPDEPSARPKAAVRATPAGTKRVKRD